MNPPGPATSGSPAEADPLGRIWRRSGVQLENSDAAEGFAERSEQRLQKAPIDVDRRFVSELAFELFQRHLNARPVENIV